MNQEIVQVQVRYFFKTERGFVPLYAYGGILCHLEGADLEDGMLEVLDDAEDHPALKPLRSPVLH